MGDLLILLDNQCLSPCYSFDRQAHTVCTMSPQTLQTTVEWISRFEPSAPGVRCQLGSIRTLDTETLKVLTAVAASVICTPIPPAEQESAGLPVMKTQIIVFPSLRDFETQAHVIRGRSCIVHVSCGEIENLSTVMDHLARSTAGLRIQFRPRDLPLWNRSCLEAYKEQAAQVKALQYRLNQRGIPVDWEHRFFGRCPALRTVVTVGPDGLCYPCPAFYHAGLTHGLEIGDLARGRVFIPHINGRCRSCQTLYCPGCLFWESGHARGEIRPCDLAPLDSDGAVPTPTGHGTFVAKRIWDGLRAAYRRKRSVLRRKAIELMKWPAFGDKYSRVIHAPAMLRIAMPLVARRDSLQILPSNEYPAGVRSGLPEMRRYRNVWLMPRLNAAYKETGEIIPLSLLQRGSHLYGPKDRNLMSMIDVRELAESPTVEKALLGGAMCYWHFGHFLLESLTRLWPLAMADLPQEVREAKVIYWPYPFRDDTTEFASPMMHLVFEGLRIGWDSIHLITQPVFVKELTIPEPALALDCGGYPIYRELLHAAGKYLVATHQKGGANHTGPKVYLSRSRLSYMKRHGTNERSLEHILQSHGFEIIHPQEMPLVEQIDTFNHAEIIAGTWGSAFHTMMLSDMTGKTVICLVGDVPDRIYFTIDRLCGVNTQYVRCMYPHPLCLKGGNLRDAIMDISRACEGIMRYL